MAAAGCCRALGACRCRLSDTIHPHVPPRRWHDARRRLAASDRGAVDDERGRRLGLPGAFPAGAGSRGSAGSTEAEAVVALEKLTHVPWLRHQPLAFAARLSGGTHRGPGSRGLSGCRRWLLLPTALRPQPHIPRLGGEDAPGRHVGRHQAFGLKGDELGPAGPDGSLPQAGPRLLRLFKLGGDGRHLPIPAVAFEQGPRSPVGSPLGGGLGGGQALALHHLLVPHPLVELIEGLLQPADVLPRRFAQHHTLGRPVGTERPQPHVHQPHVLGRGAEVGFGQRAGLALHAVPEQVGAGRGWPRGGGAAPQHLLLLHLDELLVLHLLGQHVLHQAGGHPGLAGVTIQGGRLHKLLVVEPEVLAASPALPRGLLPGGRQRLRGRAVPPWEEPSLLPLLPLQLDLPLGDSPPLAVPLLGIAALQLHVHTLKQVLGRHTGQLSAAGLPAGRPPPPAAAVLRQRVGEAGRAAHVQPGAGGARQAAEGPGRQRPHLAVGLIRVAGPAAPPGPPPLAQHRRRRRRARPLHEGDDGRPIPAEGTHPAPAARRRAILSRDGQLGLPAALLPQAGAGAARWGALGGHVGRRGSEAARIVLFQELQAVLEGVGGLRAPRRVVGGDGGVGHALGEVVAGQHGQTAVLLPGGAVSVRAVGRLGGAARVPLAAGDHGGDGPGAARPSALLAALRGASITCATAGASPGGRCQAPGGAGMPPPPPAQGSATGTVLP